MKASAPARELRLWPLVLALYLLLGLALTWPLATRLITDLPGGAHKDGLEDGLQNVWNLWWTVEALTRPTNLWVTDRLFYPDGPNLLYHTLSPVNTLMVAPITAVWGPIAGFNAVALASFALGGLGMWLLARPRAGAGPALLAGIVYVASPFHLAAIVTDGQLQIFAFHWLPWYIYFLLEALGTRADPGPRRGRRAAALAGLFLALTAWTDWYYTLFLLIFTAGALAWRLWQLWAPRGTRRPFLTQSRGAAESQSSESVPDDASRLTPHASALASLASRLAITAAVFTLGAAPLVVPMLIEAARADYMTILPPTDPWRLSADLIAYLVPQRLHRLWGAAPWDWGVGYDVNRRFFLGLTAVALAALALWRRPAARPWGLAALAFAILSLGASLRVNGVDTGLPLPYALIADMPIVRLTRQPDRFNVLVTIALGVLAAHGAATLVGAARPTKDERRKTKAAQPDGSAPDHASSVVGPSSFVLRPSSFILHPSSFILHPSSLLALLAALILLELWPAPIVTRAPEIPPYLAALPPGDGALIEYPFHEDRPYRDAERMLFQTTHGRPISGGYHSRAYPQPQLGLPVLRDLLAGSLDGDIALQPEGWPAALSTLGYTHILGYKQQPLGPLALRPEDEPAFRALVEAGLGVDAPAYEDRWLIAYEVPPADPAPVVQIRDGWGPVEQTAAGGHTRWLPASAELGLIAPTAGVYRLSFGAYPAGGPRTLVVEGPAGRAELALAPGPRRYSLMLHLPAGRTILGLSTAEPPTSGQALEGNGDLRPLSARFDSIGLAAILGR